ncbi:MAG TPA: hypothetical protein ENK18_20510, partial [Deltaproteobacteria bacterium]|nr:hypothetical protein [Deltaproteobacteria bacterium]
MEDRGRRGNALLVVVSLTTLIGFSALSVDIGLVELANAQLQVAVDSAALAASGALDGTESGVTHATEAAVELAAEHEVLGEPVALRPEDLIFGRWDGARGFVSARDSAEIDAVRIQHTPRAVRTSLANVAFGVQSVPISASSVGRRIEGAGPAHTSSCYLPLAVPVCHVDGLAEGVNPAPFRFTFGSSGASVAWGRPGSSPTSRWIEDQLEGRCDDDVLEVGQRMYVDRTDQDGATRKLKNILNNTKQIAPDPWLSSCSRPDRDGERANEREASDVWSSQWGNTIQGPVALIDAGSCDGLSLAGSYEIVGLTWGAIYDVNTRDVKLCDDDDDSGDDDNSGDDNSGDDNSGD